MHRELYILQGIYNEIFGNNILVIQIGTVVCTTFHLFLAVAYLSPTGLYVSLLCILHLVTAFGLMANVYEESELARKSWQAIHSKEFAQFRRSTRPLAVTVGSLYTVDFVDRQLILTMFDIITSNTVNLIVTYRS